MQRRIFVPAMVLVVIAFASAQTSLANPSNSGSPLISGGNNIVKDKLQDARTRKQKRAIHTNPGTNQSNQQTTNQNANDR